VRQALADKVTGNLGGIWLLVAEHLRLGTWDLLCGWSGTTGEYVEPRLAMQLVHEAAVCTSGIRAERTLHHRAGFELANGLPFVASDQAMHQLLGSHSVADSQRLQLALGQLRCISGHFQGKILVIDPHRVRSHSKRRMRKRAQHGDPIPQKMAQTFWLLDADTHQPVCFLTGTACRTASEAAIGLLDLAKEIFHAKQEPSLVLADCEHFTGELIINLHERTGFDMLVPIPNRKSSRKDYLAIPEEQFQRRWAGYATAKVEGQIRGRHPASYYKMVERFGEQPNDMNYRGFLCTSNRDELETLVTEFPKRWHVEEFFNAHQALGWNRAGTLNLNIRYGQMTMALIAQTVISQLRQRLGAPYSQWDASHLSKELFQALEADVRVTDDTIVVTYYNAPGTLRPHYEDLPNKLTARNIDPTIPWLYGYKLDFRFR
jgi:hypothetical protein